MLPPVETRPASSPVLAQQPSPIVFGPRVATTAPRAPSNAEATPSQRRVGGAAADRIERPTSAALRAARPGRRDHRRTPSAPPAAPGVLRRAKDEHLLAAGDAAYLRFEFALARTLWAVANHRGGVPAETQNAPQEATTTQRHQAACLAEFHRAVRRELASGNLWIETEAQEQLRVLLSMWPQFFVVRCLLAATMYLQRDTDGADEQLQRASIDCAGWTLGRELLPTGNNWPNEDAREATLSLLATWWPLEPIYPYVLGMRRLRNDDPASAIKFFQQAQERTPLAVNVLYGLAQAHAAAEQWTEAEQFYARLVQLAGHVDTFRFELGTAQLAGGHVEKALATWAQLVAITPSRRAHLALARTHEDLADNENALRWYCAWLQHDPLDGEVQAAAADLYARAGRHTDALRAYRRALAQDRRSLRLQLNVATALRESGDLIAALEASLAARADHGQVACVYVSLGLCQQELAQDAEAEKSYREALRLDPTAGDALQGLLNLLIAQSRYAEVADVMSLVHLCGPKDAELWARAAASAFLADDLSLYRSYLGEALALDADCATALQLMTIGSAADGNLAEEVWARRRLVELGEACQTDHRRLAEGLRLTGQAQEALTFAAMAVQTADGDDEGRVRALHELAHCHRDVGNMRATASALQLALCIDPVNIDLRNALAAARLCLGDFAGAKNLLEEVLARDPQNAQSLANLAVVEDELKAAATSH